MDGTVRSTLGNRESCDLLVMIYRTLVSIITVLYLFFFFFGILLEYTVLNIDPTIAMNLDINEASKFDVIILHNSIDNIIAGTDSKKIKIFLFNPDKADIAISIGTQLQRRSGIRVCKEAANDSRYFVLSDNMDLSQIVDELVAFFTRSGCLVRTSIGLS